MKAVKFSVAAAAALALSTAAMADSTVYGQMNAEFGSFYDKTRDAGVLGTKSFGSRIGVKASQDLGDGLTALFQMEAGINPVTSSSDDLESETGGGNGNNELSSRNSFVGLSGGFGTVLVGNHDTPYKMVARGVGTVAHSDSTATLTLNERRLKSAVAYVAPIEGMTVAAAIVPVKDNNETRVKGAGENDGMHMSLGFLMPVSDELKVAAGYESAYVSASDVTADNMFVGANFAMGAMTVGGAFETQSVDGEANYTRLLIPFTMDMGEGLFVKAALRNTDYDASDDAEMAIGVAAGKDFGKAEAYLAFNSVTAVEGDKDADTSDIAVGMRVKF